MHKSVLPVASSLSVSVNLSTSSRTLAELALQPGSRTLTAFDINLHSAKINTLGFRAEDTFVVSGNALNNPKTTVRFESELLDQLRI